MEEIIKEYGFDSLKEFNHLVANVDLSTQEKRIAFKKWQEEDGTKEGILKLGMIKE
jgi:hypothetical protein